MSDVLQLLKPITITDSKLAFCNVLEPSVGDSPDPAAWNSATTYTGGQRVHLASTHTIYEATSAAGNTNKDPSLAVNSAFWLTVGSTNRWRMFDERSTSQTSNVGTLSWTVTPSEVFNGLALVNVTGADTLQVTQSDPTAGVVYNSGSVSLRAPPSEADYYAYCFDPIERKDRYFIESLPTYPASSVTVTLTAANGTDVVGCGAFLIGKNYSIGNGIQYGARLGIQDYSRKKVNSFGDMEVTEGAYSNKNSFQMWVDKYDVAGVAKLLTSVRARPCAWRGPSDYNILTYGYLKDWEITIQYFDMSLLNLELEGLTEQ